MLELTTNAWRKDHCVIGYVYSADHMCAHSAKACLITIYLSPALCIAATGFPKNPQIVVLALQASSSCLLSLSTLTRVLAALTW